MFTLPCFEHIDGVDKSDSHLAEYYQDLSLSMLMAFLSEGTASLRALYARLCFYGYFVSLW